MLMDEIIPEDRAPRDFRAKFPDDVLQENLAGQLWFGAEVSKIHNKYSRIITYFRIILEIVFSGWVEHFKS